MKKYFQTHLQCKWICRTMKLLQPINCRKKIEIISCEKTLGNRIALWIRYAICIDLPVIWDGFAKICLIEQNIISYDSISVICIYSSSSFFCFVSIVPFAVNKNLHQHSEFFFHLFWFLARLFQNALWPIFFFVFLSLCSLFISLGIIVMIVKSRVLISWFYCLIFFSK